MDLCLIADLALIGTVLHWAKVILMVLLGLSLVIFVHEMGHFLAAKACGVKCEKFYVGFDAFEIRLGPLVIPASLWKRKWGETEYGIGILPLGGYVKMLGQDDNPANQAQEAERIRAEQQEGAASAQADSAQQEAGTGEQPERLDPRSYPAKSVPQRMMIISAGVVMNMIFAVVFAAVAYGMGVSYLPAVVGGTVAGDPAWIEDLRPGDKIVQIGRNSVPSEDLRFDRDLLPKVMLTGSERQLDLKIRRGDAEPYWVRLTPSARIQEATGRVAVGVLPPTTPQLNEDPAVYEHMAAAQADPPLQGGDRIVAIDGQPVRDFTDIQAILAQRPADELVFTVERQAEEPSGQSDSSIQLEVSVPPNPMKHLGLEMGMGPVVAIRKNSPAEQAGFRTGDLIQSVAGQPAGNPMTLPQRMLEHVDQTVTVEVLREGQTVALSVTAEQPWMYAPLYSAGAPVGVEPLGVAYEVHNTVAAVPDNGPAAQAGLQPDDQILEVQFQAADAKQHKRQRQFLGKGYEKPIELSDEASQWPHIHSLLQRMLPETQVQVTYLRDGQQHTATLTPAASDQVFFEDRGLITLRQSRVHTAESWSESWVLGFRETKEKFFEVLAVLQRLLTGQMSMKNLGSPIMIAAVAGSEASEGLPRLLMFLTFLSVNLAILNFLPIPALDGGHMVFLIAEAIRGKPVDENLQIRLSILGIGLLLALMLFVVVQDIFRFTPLGG